MDEQVNFSHDDPRSTQELINIALTSTLDTESQEDDIGNPLWTPADEARTALKFRATREVLEALCSLCTSQTANDRRVAALMLGELGIPDRTFPEECLQALLALLNDPNLDVLEAACYALGHLGHPGAIESLVNLRNHPVPGVRLGVTVGLLTHENEKAVQTLMALSRDEDEDVRDWATFGLGTQIDLDTPEIRDALVKRLNDSGDAQGEAMAGLARRKDERALKPILEALTWEVPGLSHQK